MKINGIHTLGGYDLEVDTTDGVDAQLVEAVRTAWRRRDPQLGVLRHHI
ncbi:hypothetical protein ACIA8K_20855 [Catenuloplanes sp. NPDC051500]